MALHIKSSGASARVQPANGRDFDQKELQQLIGGYVDIIQLADPNLRMVVNDEGLILDLAINMKASILAERRIAGDVVVCSVSEVK